MTVYKILRNAITPFVPICEPDSYSGEETEYCTFVINDAPLVFAEGRPHEIVCQIAMDWYLPKYVDPVEKKYKICASLLRNGFTAPYVQNATDGVGQHYIFEFEYPGGDLYGGN